MAVINCPTLKVKNNSEILTFRKGFCIGVNDDVLAYSFTDFLEMSCLIGYFKNFVQRENCQHVDLILSDRCTLIVDQLEIDEAGRQAWIKIHKEIKMF